MSLRSCVWAEILGTFLLIFFGCGAVHSAVLMDGLSGLGQVGMVWGVAIMLAAYTVGAISGAHINPAVTIAFATWGMFPKGRVMPYIVAQVLGAFLAAATLYAIFHPQLRALEVRKQVTRGHRGSELTAMCYGEYFPNPGSLGSGDEPYDPVDHAKLDDRVDEWMACLAEVIGTAILGLVIAATTNPRQPSGPMNLAPVFIGLTVTCLICVIAPLTQACFNPARDFGPRLFAYFAGWGVVALPGPRPTGFLTVYILSPIIGAIIGIGLYQRLLRPVAEGPPQ